MNVIYRLSSDILCDEKGNAVNTYGISAYDSDGKLLASLPAVFLDADKATELVNLCNDEKLDISQLFDLADDIFSV